MQTIIIKDLAKTEDLDSKEMAAVVGGTGKPVMPAYYCGPFIDVAKNDYCFDATQQLGQAQQSTVNNGNNAAFVCGIDATVQPCQNGKNSINVRY